MKKCLSIFLAALTLILAVSCMQVDTKVNVKKDGSGTINLTMVMNPEVIAAMTGSKDAVQNPFSKQDFISIAKKYGKGVTLESYQEVKNDKQIGGKATYKFKDINAVTISAIPETDKNQGADNSKGGQVTFSYNKGLLTIQLDDNDDDDEGGNEREESSDELEKTANIMKQLLKDMKINMVVAVDGKVTSSNATFREGSKITLYDIDFNQILQNETAFNSFISSNMDKKALNTVKGVNIEERDSVDVNFR